MGNPASHTSTPSMESCLAIFSFSSIVSVAPGLCSPSRSVVSKKMRRSRPSSSFGEVISRALAGGAAACVDSAARRIAGAAAARTAETRAAEVDAKREVLKNIVTWCCGTAVVCG